MSDAPRRGDIPQSALDAIRQRPSMYFARSKPSNGQLISHLVEDASLREPRRIEVLRDGDWCMVWSDTDWMEGLDTPVAELFERFVPCRAGSRDPNMFRAEVLVRAAARTVWAVGAAGEYERNLTLGELPLGFEQTARQAARAVIWRLA
jgi:hypothetical protein